MTTALWILLIIALLLTAVLLLKVGVDAQYDGETLFLRVLAGPIRLTLLPRRKKPKKENKKKEKPPKEAVKEEREKKKISLPPLPTLLKLAKLVLEAVGAFRRKLSVDLLRLHLRVGTDDPYRTAMTYAYARAGLDGLYPLAARALTIRERDVRLNADFVSGETTAQGQLKLTIRIGQIVGIALVLVWKALWVLLRQPKKAKRKKQTAEAQPAPEERTVPNG